MLFDRRSRGGRLRRDDALSGLPLLTAATGELVGHRPGDAGEELFAASHRETTRWGSDRFAMEFRRREEEERRAARSARWERGRFFAGLEAEASTEALTRGPVAAEVADAVIEPQVDDLPLERPLRHPHVPRPPADDPEPEPRGRGRRRRRRDAVPDAAEPIPDSAWGSPGARRLYGLKDPLAPRAPGEGPATPR